MAGWSARELTHVEAMPTPKVAAARAEVIRSRRRKWVMTEVKLNTEETK